MSVHHQLPELAQTHVYRVGDTIEPSHPLLSPSPGDLSNPGIKPMSPALQVDSLLSEPPITREVIINMQTLLLLKDISLCDT